MTAQRLIRFYPRVWRERYGNEFLEVVGERRLSVQQAVDILAGAVDAWMSPRVRASVRGSVGADSSGGGAAMIQQLKAKCATSTPRYTTRDGLVSAGVLLVISIVISIAGILANRAGHRELGEALKGLSFPVAVLFSMPFAILKGQSRRSQVVILSIPLAILIVASYVATKI